MVDYEDSSQLSKWLLKSPAELSSCRAKANLKAREYLIEREKKLSNDGSPEVEDLPTAIFFARGYSQDIASGKQELLQNAENELTVGPVSTEAGHPFLTPAEESTLVQFYASKLPSLIGPNAQVPRLRRESKVTATAALLFRRFFLSNSVMLFDPKAVMVASAFLGAKVEDATTDVRYLEEGTALMNAPVSQAEIIPAEIALLAGTYFELLCFHPYKAVVALTEDLRTFLKTDRGQQLLLTPGTVVSGQELKSIYDGARQIIDQVIVSDIPLLYSPGQVGLAALVFSNERLSERSMDLRRYLKLRFPNRNDNIIVQDTLLQEVITMMSQLPPPEASTSNEELIALKAAHKKLKKVRVWGKSGGKKSKKKKKSSGGADGAPPSKRQKTEA